MTGNGMPGPKADHPPGGAVWVRAALGAGILAVAAYVALLSLLPPTSRDALIHHLAIPKIWLQAGGFVETPWAGFSYYPMNLELLYLIPMALGADFAAHFIHHAFGLLTAYLIFRHLRRRTGAGWGLLGALLFLSTPMVMRLAASAYVDLGLTFFLTAAVFSLLEWHESRRTGFLLLSAAALGLGLGTKYQGLIALPPMVLFVLYSRSKAGGGPVKAFAWAAVYGALAAAVFSPWAIKNFILTGNPTFPLFNAFWGLPDPNAGIGQVDMFTWRNWAYGESIIEVLLLPVRFFVQGRDYSHRLFDGVLNPVFLVMPIVALVRSRGRETLLFALFSAYWVAVVFMRSGHTVRYLVPVLPLLTVLAVYGLAGLWEALTRTSRPRAGTAVFGLVMAGFLALNVMWAGWFWRDMAPGRYLRGQESREAYLSGKLPYYPVLSFINQRVDPGARVLFLFAGSQGYYCERDYFYSTWLSGEILRPVIEAASTGREVRDGVRRLGATHLFVRDDLLYRHFVDSYPEEKLRLVADFRRTFVKRLHASRGFSVYRIE